MDSDGKKMKLKIYKMTEVFSKEYMEKFNLKDHIMNE